MFKYLIEINKLCNNLITLLILLRFLLRDVFYYFHRRNLPCYYNQEKHNTY